MKEKIIAAIKAKFANVNLSKTRLDAIAAKIEGRVAEDETKIDAELDLFNEFNPLAEMAKTDDQIRGLQAKAKPQPKDDPKPADEPDPKSADDTPAWAKTLMEQNKTLTERLQAIEGEKVATTVKSKAAEQLKEVPAGFWSKRALPENEDGIEAFVTEVKSDYTSFQQEWKDQSLGVLSTPRSGGNPPAEKQVSPEIKSFVEKRAASTAK